jgi:hypothetical protein
MGYQYIKAPGFRLFRYFTARYTKTGGAVVHPKARKIDWSTNPCNNDEYPRNSTTSISSAFHLPEVCRKIYSETATLGYSLNTFVITSSHLNYNNWATGLLLAYRRAIQNIEPDPSYLESLTVRRLVRPIKSRDFPELTTIMVSNIALDYISYKYKRTWPDCTTDDWKPIVERNIHENHGQDLEVVFQQADNISD